MPAYTTPVTAVVGAPLSAANWNAGVRDSLEDVAKPKRVRALRAGAQSIPNSAATAISWTGEEYDEGGLWVIGAPTRLTVPAGAGGMWHVGVSAHYALNGTGARQMLLTKNGAGIAAFNGAGSATWIVGTVLSCDTAANAGDYFETTMFHSSGAALNIEALGMWAHQVSR